MALKKSYHSTYGTNHPQAYHKIIFCNINIAGTETVECKVGIYATEAAKNANSGSIGESFHLFAYSSSIDESQVSQSYEHLKTLDEYSGATDV